MSRPRMPNIIAHVDGRPDLRALIVYTSQVGCAPVIYYYFDTVNLPLVEQHHWAAGKSGRAAAHTHPTRDTVYLARLLAGAQLKQRVIHLDGDVTNLRRSNLHICTPAPITLRRRALFAARVQKSLDTVQPLV